MPGIRLHREIDRFTDQHPVVAKACREISTDRRRLAGIIVDIAFDYYLTRHWSQFSNEERESTISRGYATMAMVASTGFSRKTQSLISKMRSSDWLTAYGTLEGQQLTFRRVSRISPAIANLKGAEEEIVKNDSIFEQCFLDFYPELMRNVSNFQGDTFPSESERCFTSCPTNRTADDSETSSPRNITDPEARSFQS